MPVLFSWQNLFCQKPYHFPFTTNIKQQERGFFPHTVQPTLMFKLITMAFKLLYYKNHLFQVIQNPKQFKLTEVSFYCHSAAWCSKHWYFFVMTGFLGRTKINK